MLQEFNTLVRPVADRLAVLLDTDYTVIPVTVKHKDGTTQIIEDGVLVECDHAGAKMGQVDLSDLKYNPNTEQVEPVDHVRRGLLCEHCTAWSDGEAWYE